MTPKQLINIAARSDYTAAWEVEEGNSPLYHIHLTPEKEAEAEQVYHYITEDRALYEEIIILSRKKQHSPGEGS